VRAVTRESQGIQERRMITDASLSQGTAANSLVDVFNKIVEKRRCQLNYVIPISDNGGSSSELIRFVGGPSVGDIRSESRVRSECGMKGSI
jgi:hypothetical protein